ncbi:MAG: hypothetical protein ACW991_09850 [Candidatus Hodarchaeales archaeon]|jgi:hypothetical protein
MVEENKQKPMVVFTRWNPYLVIGSAKFTNSTGKSIHLDNVQKADAYSLISLLENIGLNCRFNLYKIPPDFRTFPRPSLE